MRRFRPPRRCRRPSECDMHFSWAVFCRTVVRFLSNHQLVRMRVSCNNCGSDCKRYSYPGLTQLESDFRTRRFNDFIADPPSMNLEGLQRGYLKSTSLCLVAYSFPAPFEWIRCPYARAHFPSVFLRVDFSIIVCIRNVY